VNEPRPGKCPHCPAEYSTEQEMRQHLGNVGHHRLDRIIHRLDLAPVAAARAFLSDDEEDMHLACRLLADLADAIDAVKPIAKGYTVDDSPEAIARVRERFGMSESKAK
jgi:hypothetical protein